MFSGIKLFHIIVTIAVFHLFWLLFRYSAPVEMGDNDFRYDCFVTFGYGLCLIGLNRVYNSFLLGYRRISALVFTQFLAQLFSTVIIYGVFSVARGHWRSPLWFVPLLLADGLLDIAWSLWGNWLFFRLNPVRNTILVYRREQDKRRFGEIRGKPIERLYRVTRELQYDGHFHGLLQELEGYDAVFVAGVNSRCRNGILKHCKATDTPCLFLPHIGDVIMQEATHIQSFDTPVLYVARSDPKPEYRITKRLFDIVLSLAGIIALSPVMAATALAVRLCDGGPALFRQVRLTRGGRRFTMLKFRSMRLNAEGDGRARLSTGARDDRVTPVGRVIRKYRLDEIPQLVNILMGDMSFVGPRPERPELAEQYYRTIPDFRLRLQVKAGLTGYAQVYGKYNTGPYEKLQFDLLYINNMSILTDIGLLFATVTALFAAESTDGVFEDADMPKDNPGVLSDREKPHDQRYCSRL